MTSHEFYEQYHHTLARQLFADANNLPFALAALKAILPGPGHTVGAVIGIRAKQGDIECRVIMDAYGKIKDWDDHEHISTLLARWNQWRKGQLPGAVFSEINHPIKQRKRNRRRMADHAR